MSEEYRSSAQKMHDKAGKILSTRASIHSSNMNVEQSDWDKMFPNGFKRKELQNEDDKAGGDKGPDGIKKVV
jgi:hypothetical protein